MDSGVSFPANAKVVIVGGGVIGTSVAYHLAKLGWKEVVLLEQGQLGGGTSWHAAGLVGRLRTSNSMTRINKYTVELYSQLEQETGHSVGWRQVGSLIVAKSEDRMIQLRRTMAMAELFGVEAHLISPQAAFDKWPLLRVDDVIGAAWLPHDGKVIPKEVPVALGIGARNRGVSIFENVRVLGIERENGRATGVRTDQGNIRAEYIVLCGGMWTRELGLSCGVTIPLYPVEHHYVVTEPLPEAEIEFVSFSRDDRRVIVHAHSERDRGTFYLLDRDRGQLARIGSGDARLKAEALAPARAFRFSARDGVEIEGRITLPPANGRPPLIVRVGPTLAGGAAGGEFDPVAQFLASRGFASVRVATRGTSGRGKTFRRAGDLQPATGMAHDLEDAAAWLAAQGWIDARRIALWGEGLGGIVAAHAAAGGAFRALVIQHRDAYARPRNRPALAVGSRERGAGRAARRHRRRESLPARG